MHDAATSMPPQAPSTWADYLAGYRWRGQGEGCSAATVHRLEAARRPTLFVKQEVLSAHAELPAESLACAGCTVPASTARRC